MIAQIMTSQIDEGIMSKHSHNIVIIGLVRPDTTRSTTFPKKIIPNL